MHLKNDRIVVTLGNIVLRSFKLGTPQDFILDPTAVVGWTDGVATRRGATPRSNTNGDFSEKSTKASRIISFSGTAIASNRSELQNMRDEFTALFVDGGYGPISVETSVDTRYSTVGVEGTPSWVQQLDNVALWKIDLYAPDPFIYGGERTVQTGAVTSLGGLRYNLSYPLNYNLVGSNTVQTVMNHGNAESWPTFRVTGDYFSGFSVTDNLGNVVTYSGMVTFASPVTIDMGNGTAIQSGVDKTVLLTQRGWFSIPAGATIQPQFAPLQNGSGWCDIIYRDTWI